MHDSDVLLTYSAIRIRFFLSFQCAALLTTQGKEKRQEYMLAAFALFREIKWDFSLSPSEYRVSALPGIKKAKAILGAKALAEGTGTERDPALEARLSGVHACARLSIPFLGRTDFSLSPHCLLIRMWTLS